MNDEKKRFTSTVRCEHCNNSAPMEIVSEYSKVKEYYHEEADVAIDEGDIYQLINRPACDEVTLPQILLRCLSGSRRGGVGYIVPAR